VPAHWSERMLGGTCTYLLFIQKGSVALSSDILDPHKYITELWELSTFFFFFPNIDVCSEYADTHMAAGVDRILDAL